MKFSEMEIGNNYVTNVMLTSVTEKQSKNGGTYLDINMIDGDNEVNAKYFSMNKNDFAHEKGDIISVNLNVKEFNGSKNFNITKHYVPEGEVYKGDFIITAPVDAEEMYEFIFDTLKGLKNKELATITTRIYTDFRSQLLYWSAAMTHHHNCYSGLLYHSYRMVKSAIQLVQVYSNCDAGAALHDIGKLKELSTDEFGVAEYTEDGNLFGHLFIGAELLTYYGNKCKISKEVMRNLKHIIISHHENLEWGAITRPATMEAFLVSQIDYIDSQIYVFEKEEKDIEPGYMSENRVLGGIHVYFSAQKTK